MLPSAQIERGPSMSSSSRSGLVADRMAALPDAPAASLSGDVIDLSGDLPGGQPPPGIEEAVAASLDAGETHYTDRLGIFTLRERLGAVLADRDAHNFQPSELLITSGRNESLFAAIQALTGQSGQVIVVEPDLPDYARLAVLRGKPVLPLVGAGGGTDWPARLATVADAVATGDVVVLAMPSRVTGQMPGAEALGVLRVVAEREATLILDTTLLGLGRDGPLNLRALSRVGGLSERTVVLGTFAVEYGLAPWGVGYVAARQDRLKAISAMVQSMNICVAAPSQYAALAALDAPDEWISAQIARRRQTADRAIDALEQHGLSVVPGDVAGIVWVDAHRLGVTSRDVAKRLEANGVLVAPGTRFGQSCDGYIRLTLPNDRATLDRTLDRISAALAAR
jgi:aspartate/methionine/tyrosine aminotransferase